MDRPHGPERMADAVSEESAIAGSSVAPFVFLEVVRGIGYGRYRGCIGADRRHGMLATAHEPAVGDAYPVTADRRGALHSCRLVWLVVHPPSDGGYESLGDELANERDPAVGAMPDIRPQIDFGERDVAGHATEEHSRVMEIERNETHMGLPLPPVEVERGVHDPPNQCVRDLVGNEDQVGPASGEEDAQLAGGERGAGGERPTNR